MREIKVMMWHVLNLALKTCRALRRAHRPTHTRDGWLKASCTRPIAPAKSTVEIKIRVKNNFVLTHLTIVGIERVEPRLQP